VVAVAGDAEKIAPMLRSLGEVRVVDPSREFVTVRVLPQDPSAPLEEPREEGR
jgi:hypothetical protein